MHRRTLVGALPALAILKTFAQAADGAASQPAGAAAGRKYVCLSLVANEIQYVQPASAQMVGHNLQHNEITTEPAGKLHLDEAALVAMNEALDRCSAKGAPRSFLLGSDAAFFEEQYDWFSGDRLTLPPKLAKSVEGEHGTHLLLLTKYLGNAADIKTDDFGVNLGRGRVSGVGVYRDPNRPGTVDGGTHDGEAVDGFLAPFVSVRLSLVELASGRVLGQKASLKARALSRSSESARFVMLQDEIQQAVRQTLPPLVDAS
jgi:hypothetical protein